MAGGSTIRRWGAATAVVLGCLALLFVAAQIQLRLVLKLPPEQVSADKFVVPLGIGVTLGVLLAVIRELFSRDRHLRRDLAAREQALAEANRGLEAKVAERTRALEAAHQQLLHTQRLEAVGQVAGGVAHDFNNMLTVVFACLEALEPSARASPEIRTPLSELRAACDRARQLTRQLLIFSRKDAVRVELVELKEMVEGILPMTRRLVGPQVALDVEVEPKLAVRCDRGQLEQVLVNLVINARDAGANRVRLQAHFAPETDGRAVSLDAPAGDLEARERRAIIAVVDDGNGMSPSTVKRATEPFFTTKAPGRGTGLGLSVAATVARELGGQLDIESTEGKGTAIRILLPGVVRPPSAVAPGESSPAASQGGAKLVLLVEDDAVVRRTVHRLLSSAGFDVLEADSVASAREALSQHGAKLRALLTDLRLPDGSGAEIVELVASLQPPIPALAMTGFLDDADREKLGSVEVLAKPFAGRELVARIHALVASA